MHQNGAAVKAFMHKNGAAVKAFVHKNGVLKYLFTQVFGVIHLYFPLQSQRSKQTPNKGVCWHKASQNRQLNI
jgi:hypothetical protein